VPPHRARSIVLSVVAIAGIIGVMALARRAMRPKEDATPAPAVTATASTSAPAPSFSETPLASASPSASTSAAVEADAGDAGEGADAADAAETGDAVAEAAAEDAAVDAAAAADAVGDAVADPDATKSGPQLLGEARAALNGGNNVRAVALARKAAAKGAGGSAYYVMGAAYQNMGSTGAAKGAYESCAKSGCAEASECEAIAGGM